MATPALTMALLLKPHGRQGQWLMKGVWAMPTDICGCSTNGELMLELGEAALPTDFMELDESIVPASVAQ